MADPMNPFLTGGDDLDVTEIQETLRTPSKESTPESLPDADGVSFDQVAAKLIKDRFLLTSLELHTELLESGRELPRLRDFFSNPANFERTRHAETVTSPSGLPRTSSVQTFDSLDFARYSDDGNQQENDKVAVLEFELRKAQETIKSLRETLTKTAENELSTPEQVGDKLEEFIGGLHLGAGVQTDTDIIKPYEQRALNFLVNEYLLLNDYKLTSVTLAEENENQDFEYWDDVGLNVPKPPPLLHLFRDFGQHAMPERDVCEAEVQTEVDEEEEEEEGTVEEEEDNQEEMQSKMTELEEEIKRLTDQNAELMIQMTSLQREQLTVSLPIHTSTPAKQPAKAPARPPVAQQADDIDTDAEAQAETTGADDTTMETEPPDGGAVVAPPSDSSVSVDDVVVVAAEEEEVSDPLEERRHADPPARPETEGMDSSELTRQSLSDSVLVHPGTTDVTRAAVVTGAASGADSTNVSIATSGDTPGAPKGDLENLLAYQPSQRHMSAAFQKALLSTVFHVSHDNRIVSELSNITDSSGDTVVLMLGRCLPHIVPNVLIAKREELIPLILCTATLHPDAKQRDQLLNILFNLIKKPDLEQRQLILTGCVAFAQHVGPQRVEAELLPQCWEQLAHKYPERRLLVAESCGTLAPYIPPEMRSSLVLSMLQQMVTDDKAEEVREAAVRSLGLLMGFVDDPDKFNQGVELLVSSLSGPERVVMAAQAILLPALAVWAAELQRLHTHLVPSFLDKMEDMVKQQQQQQNSPGFDKSRFCLLVGTLHLLVPHMFSMVLISGPYAENITTATQTTIALSRFPPSSSELTDLAVIVGDGVRLARLEQLYQQYVAQEWYEPWETYAWAAGDFLPHLLTLLNSLDSFVPEVVHSLTQLVTAFCQTFGQTFTATKVKPQFQRVLSIPQDHIGTDIVNGTSALTKCTVPVYTAGVLAVFNEPEDLSQLSEFLQDLLCTLALCQVSLDCLKAAFVQLALESSHHEMLLSVLWDGVVHTSAHVRGAAAKMFELLVEGVSETMIGTRIIPALVTLASDPEMTVRIATVPAFGTVMESVTDRTVLDKVQLQFQSFLDDPGYADQQQMQLAMIKTLARVGPNAEPRFRDDFVLPRLAIIAAGNNHVAMATRRQEVAIQLFEAYSALSCCFVSDAAVEASMLPGLRCLLRDCQDVQHDHTNIVGSIIHELEEKIARGGQQHQVAPGGPGPLGPPGGENKTNVFNRFRDIKDRAAVSKSNFSKIFSKK